jgi:uncharacterized protein (DUF1015 family)
VPRFEPFAALRFAPDSLDARVSPPYDVLTVDDVMALRQSDPHNITHVDVPLASDGPDPYAVAADRLRSWIADGELHLDGRPSFTICRMSFTDETGRPRTISGVIGALEVVDEGAGGVLPHERTTPKASTDRLDLTRATDCNLSPVWGLSLADGLTEILAEPGDVVGVVVRDGVEHRFERVDDPSRVARISAAIGVADVLIADGHHRYGIARRHRDDRRAETGGDAGAAELTMTFVNELVADQLAVAAIHRLYTGCETEQMLAALGSRFDVEEIGSVTEDMLATMAERGALCAVDRLGVGRLLLPRAGAFSGLRSLDGLWLEDTFAGVAHEVRYQHGVAEVLAELAAGRAEMAILIRPVPLAEIVHTARAGALMPPKSTFFTPKLLTGPVIRPLDGSGVV